MRVHSVQHSHLCIPTYTQTGKIKEVSIPGEYIREGLTAVVSVKVAEPEFEGQTKTRLGGYLGYCFLVGGDRYAVPANFKVH